MSGSVNNKFRRINYLFRNTVLCNVLKDSNLRPALSPREAVDCILRKEGDERENRTEDKGSIKVGM